MTHKRRFVIREIKKPMMRAIVVLARDYPKRKKFLERALIVLAKRYPDPTRENTRYHNTHILLDIRDRFFEYFVFEDELERRAFEAAWKIIIVEYEHDPYYQYRIDCIIEYVTKMGLGSELPIEDSLDILIATRDKFFKYERNPGRDALFKALWQIFIFEYKHDPKQRIDWAFREIKESDWEPRKLRKEQCWKEPIKQRHGVFHLR